MSKKAPTDKTKKRQKPLSRLTMIDRVENITEYRLETNDLKVLFAHVPGSPTVTSCLVYHIGSQHEGKGETGLAHMLEHMLFKQTGTEGPTWRMLEEKGAVYNATTWLDRTLYYFNLPKQYLPEMLFVEADRMRNVKLTKKEFEPERANVLSEYEMYNSNPESALDWNLVASAFQSHGYKHDTIGFRTDIEAYTTKKLQSFYDRYYWPNNATLIIAGDVSEVELIEAISDSFGSIPRNGQFAHDAGITDVPQEGVRRVSLERNTPLRVLSLAFKAPRSTDRAWNALLIALLHLTDGKTSILYKKLVETNLATSIDGNIYPTKDPYLALFQVSAAEKSSYEEIERIVRMEIDKLKNSLISKNRLEELIAHAYASELFSRDGTLNVALQLAEYVACGDWKRYTESLEELCSITALEIQQAVRTYLRTSKSIVGTIVPISQV